MTDADIVAASPSRVYRVLKGAGLRARWKRMESKKGTGCEPPRQVPEHWPTDVSYLNIRGTFYYLGSVLDGLSRTLLHGEIGEAMTEADVEIVLPRAREKYPDVRPRIISDNGPQFSAKDCKEFIRLSGMTHVRTRPYYPQSNGKQERWPATLKREDLRPLTPLSLEDARRIVANFVTRYNAVRLHRALGYVTPKDKLEGRAEAIMAARERKLPAAWERRVRMRRGTFGKRLTGENEENKVPGVGETEVGKAGERPARDSRPGRRTTGEGESSDSPVLILTEAKEDVQSPFLPHNTPGCGAEPQDLVTAKAPGGSESLVGERHLSISR